MNRRNFLKASAYAGITIITSKGIVFPKKEIIVPSHRVYWERCPNKFTRINGTNMELAFTGDEHGFKVISHVSLIDETDVHFRNRVREAIDEKLFKAMMYGDWSNEDRRVREDDKRRLGYDIEENVEWKNG